jgi:hypothetical protein
MQLDAMLVSLPWSVSYSRKEASFRNAALAPNYICQTTSERTGPHPKLGRSGLAGCEKQILLWYSLT